MRLGIITWFNRDKGVGMIRPTQGGRDVYFFSRAIRGNEEPRTGFAVEFEVIPRRSRAKAQWVRALPDGPRATA